MRFVFLFFSLRLFASLDEGYILASLESPPELLIENCVNAITGDLIFTETDHVIEAPEPLAIKRTYLSRLGWEKEGGWHFFPHIIATLDKDFPYLLTFQTSNGTKRFYQPLKKKPQQPLYFKPVETSFEEGLTNITFGSPSAQTNLLNYACELSPDQKNLFILTPRGTLRKYQRTLESKDFLRYIYLLQKEFLPNTNSIYYSYDANDRLSEIKTTNRKGNKIYAWAHFTYDNDRIQLDTSDGKNISYGIKTIPTIYESITPFTTSPNGTYTYDFEDRPKLIKTTFFDVEYYKRHLNDLPSETIDITSPYDLRLNRVKTIKFPHKTYHFLYTPEIPGRMGGSTEVTDSDGNKILFTYTEQLRPEQITYKTHAIHFTWHGHLLRSKILFDEQNQPACATRFEYDHYGNPIKEYHYTPPFSLPLDDTSPCEIIRRTFSPYHQLLTEETPSETTHFSYIPHTNLKARISNSKMIQNFFYNDDYILIRTSEDPP